MYLLRCSLIFNFFIVLFCLSCYGQEIANKQCEKYVNDFKNTRIPARVKRIVGGTSALPREFPFMASLGYGEGEKTKRLCGGSLISENFVLTAAQCAFSRDDGPVKTVRLGSTKLTNTTEQHPTQDITVKKIHVHPDYVPRIRYNDIALLELSKNVSFSSTVSPACLNTESKSIDDPVVAIGWGLVDYAGEPSNDLLKATLKIISADECSKLYPSSITSLSKGIQSDTQACAQSADKTPRDTCQGDSGGPLLIQKENKNVIVGITSFGRACGLSKSPGVYTKVNAFIPWIESIVWK